MTRDLGDWLADEADRAPTLDPATVAVGLERGRLRVARRRRRTTWGVVGGAVVAVVAVAVTTAVVDPGGSRASSGPVAPTTTSPPVDLPVETVDGEPLVTCGGSAGWPASVMADGIGDVLDDAEVRDAFRAILRSTWRLEAELSLFPRGVDAVEWRLLRADGTSFDLGLGSWTDDGPSERAVVLRLDRTDGRWSTSGWASCRQVEPVLRAGHTWVQLDGFTTSTDSTIVVTGHERDCTGARDPQPFLHPFRTVETGTTVTIYGTSEPPGSATCPGNPSTQVEVALHSPLDGRTVLDGSTYPPRTLTRRP